MLISGNMCILYSNENTFPKRHWLVVTRIQLIEWVLFRDEYQVPKTKHEAQSIIGMFA